MKCTDEDARWAQYQYELSLEDKLGEAEWEKQMELELSLENQ